MSASEAVPTFVIYIVVCTFKDICSAFLAVVRELGASVKSHPVCFQLFRNSSVLLILCTFLGIVFEDTLFFLFCHFWGFGLRRKTIVWAQSTFLKKEVREFLFKKKKTIKQDVGE